jgi:hypothetical protein
MSEVSTMRKELCIGALVLGMGVSYWLGYNSEPAPVAAVKKKQEELKEYHRVEMFSNGYWVKFDGSVRNNQEYRAVYRNKIGDEEVERIVCIHPNAVLAYVSAYGELRRKCPLDPDQIDRVLEVLPNSTPRGGKNEIVLDDVERFMDVYRRNGLEGALAP